MPLQECDALLHEAGAPPIHTPLAVLKALPDHVKERLYVVHTSALPTDCGLRVAPTGTSGTIRLDQRVGGASPVIPCSRRTIGAQEPLVNGSGSSQIERFGGSISNGTSGQVKRNGFHNHVDPSSVRDGKKMAFDFSSLDDGGYPNLTVMGDYLAPDADALTRYANGGKHETDGKLPPLVFLRPTCVSDAWFILNLLSAVPFFSR